jgi:hypothetical protein
MILFNLRQGIGLDIEYNEDIQHTISDGEKDYNVAFAGIIIKIPFLSIYIGDFFDIEG